MGFVISTTSTMRMGASFLSFQCVSDSVRRCRRLTAFEHIVHSRRLTCPMQAHHFPRLLLIEGAVPFGDGNRGDAVADEIRDRAGLVHEAVDPKQEDETGHRYRVNG